MTVKITYIGGYELTIDDKTLISQQASVQAHYHKTSVADEERHVVDELLEPIVARAFEAGRASAHSARDARLVRDIEELHAAIECDENSDGMHDDECSHDQNGYMSAADQCASLYEILEHAGMKVS